MGRVFLFYCDKLDTVKLIINDYYSNNYNKMYNSLKMFPYFPFVDLKISLNNIIVKSILFIKN